MHAVETVEEIDATAVVPWEPLGVKQIMLLGVFIRQSHKASVDVRLEVGPQLVGECLVLAIVRRMPFERDWRVEGQSSCGCC